MPNIKKQIPAVLAASLAFAGSANFRTLAANGYTIINPSATQWSNSRSVDVSGGVTTTDTSTTLNIDSSKASPNYFIDYEGITTTTVDQPSNLSGELYIDPDWSTNVRVSFWGYGYNDADTLASYNIIEYSNITNQDELDYIKNHNSTGGDITSVCAANNCSYDTGWNVFDDDNGVWHNLPDVSAIPGTHTLEFQVTETGAVDYVIDGVTAYTIAIDAVAYFGNFALEAMNALSNFTDNQGDYAVTFSSIGYGITTAPVSSPSTNADAALVDNVVINGQAVTVLSTEQISSLANTFVGADRVLMKSLTNPIFLRLANNSHWTGNQVVTLSGLTPNKVYQLYHYDDSGNITTQGTFDSDADGYIDVTLTSFSGNILAETNGIVDKTPLAPNTGSATRTGTDAVSIIYPTILTVVLVLIVGTLIRLKVRR